MDNKTRNLELEAWLIETTGEEMMANHLGPNWNRFNEEFCFYPNMSMTIADQVWQHQQAKVEGLTYKAQLRESDHQALLVKYQATKKCWEDISKETAELQKQLIDQGQRFNDQAQRVKDLEYKNGELQKRVDAALQEIFKCRVAGLNRIYALDVIEQALKGEG